MEAPICVICAKTGALCSKCEEKLSKGLISEMDVELTKYLIETNQEDIGFDRAIEFGDHIDILTKKKYIGKLIGRGGENLRNISQRLGKPVRVIGAEGLEETIKSLVAPAQITSINTVYLPAGGILKRIKLRRGDKDRLRMDVKEIQKIASSLVAERIEIVAD